MRVVKHYSLEEFIDNLNAFSVTSKESHVIEPYSVFFLLLAGSTSGLLILVGVFDSFINDHGHQKVEVSYNELKGFSLLMPEKGMNQDGRVCRHEREMAKKLDGVEEVHLVGESTRGLGLVRRIFNHKVSVVVQT
jgi:hypothetical protein